jgi:hypothetical protein
MCASTEPDTRWIRLAQAVGARLGVLDMATPKATPDGPAMTSQLSRTSGS